MSKSHKALKVFGAITFPLLGGFFIASIAPHSDAQIIGFLLGALLCSGIYTIYSLFVDLLIKTINT